MQYHCIIIEDQLPAQRILMRYIEDIPELILSGSFTDPLEALAFMQQQMIDLVFLDIHLPKISGLDFLKILPYKPKVILTTAFSEYALEGYELDVVDYLLKPISFERFIKAVSKVIYPTSAVSQPSATPEKSEPSSTDSYIFVKSDRSLVKINFNSIIYIKSEDDYTRVITENKNYFLSYPLKYWLDLLPEDRFCRIHKSYLVNLRKIEKIEGNLVFIDKEKLPIGRSFREGFLAKLKLS